MRRKQPPEPVYPLRNASDPYPLRLREPYTVRHDDLREQVDASIYRSCEVYDPAVREISFTGSELVLEMNYEGKNLHLRVGIAQDCLMVSCDCGQQVRSICLHAYRVLSHSLGFCRSDYFKDYQPVGLVEIATRYPKYFDKETNRRCSRYLPKKEMGVVYLLSGEDGVPVPQLPLSVPAPSLEPEFYAPSTAVCFVLAATYRARQLPVLLPCTGLLNKAGTVIKSFGRYLSGFEKENLHRLTPDQQALNTLGLALLKQGEPLTGDLQKACSDDMGAMQRIFEGWASVLPMLCSQEFTFLTMIGRPRDLKGKPDKKRTTAVRFRRERPELLFRLLDKKDYYEFAPLLRVREKIIAKPNTEFRLFLRLENDLYLLASLRDALLLEWMGSFKGRCVVFKEHFGRFEQEVLAPIRKHHTIIN